jgi:hypothetical protein
MTSPALIQCYIRKNHSLWAANSAFVPMIVFSPLDLRNQNSREEADSKLTGIYWRQPTQSLGVVVQEISL